MKFTITFLTLLVAVLASSPRTGFGQYAWVPVYSDGSASSASEDAAPTTPYVTQASSDYATYIGDLEDGLAEGGGGGGGDGSCDSSCGKSSKCHGCRGYGWMDRAFVGVEYLQWWNKGRYIPPVVTTNPNNGILPAARILVGNETVGDDLKAGGRITAGFWLDDHRESALFIRGYGTEGDNTGFDVASNGNPLLAVPFFDAFPPAGLNSLVVAQAGVAGRISGAASNDIIGGDILYRTLLDQGCDYRIDLLAGYQMARIDDDIELRTASALNNATTYDRFDVNNEYHGGQAGLFGEFYRGPLTVQLMGKIGIGNMQQTVDIRGQNTFQGIIREGGLFARPSNIGVYERDSFVWSPEASIKLSYALRKNVSLTVGYTFLYWSKVALAAEQIDPSVNSQALFNGLGADTTQFAFADTGFWVQTIDLGFTFRY